jgi:hypothetical protein
MGKYLVAFGTPHHVETALHDTQGTAKSALLKALRERKKWGEHFSHATRDEVQAIISQVSSINLDDAKVGRQWEWEAHDEVSRMTFVYRLVKQL